LHTTPPRLSYVVPVYNGATLIGRCIESILNQQGDPPQVIVVDDGSSDETRDVVARDRTSVLSLTQANAGPAAARNHGLRYVTGDLVCFIDHDDYVLGPHRAVVEKSWQADFDLLVGLEANQKGDTICLAARNNYEDVPDACGMLAEFIQDNCIQTSTFVWSKRYLNTIGGWDEAIWGIDDIELAMRAFLMGANVGKSDELAWVVWCRMPGSLSSSVTKRNAASQVLALRKQLAMMQESSACVSLQPQLFARGAGMARYLHLNGLAAEGDQLLAWLEAHGYGVVAGPMPEVLMSRLFGTRRILRLRHRLGRAKRSLR
jgi:hypothetical protein